MCMHPQEIEDRKETERENNLWWELDKICVKNSEYCPKSTRDERMKKANAAEAMMAFLQKPTPEWIKRRLKEGKS